MAMKKLFRSLITLALSAPLLSGCSLFEERDLPVESNVNKLELRDFKTYALLNEGYAFDGKVMLIYKDATEKEVTKSCTFSTVDTSKVGTAEFKAYYETTTKIYSVKAYIEVRETKPQAKSIEASGYSTSVDKGSTYTFDGTVKVIYEGGSSEPVDNKDLTFGDFSTAVVGKKSLTIRYKVSTSSMLTTSIDIEVVAKVRGIDAPSTFEIGEGRTKSLKVSVLPTDATNKELTFVSADPSIADVNDNGQVTGKEGKVGQSTKITVSSKEDPSITAEITVTVVEASSDEWTIMIYMCGADLESNGQTRPASASGLASSDLDEILQVSNQPEEVNIIVETGGAKSWQSGHSYSISSEKLERWHVENQKLVKDDTLSTYSSMGLSSTLQSFLEWGLETYPADKTGVIFWNHGGGMTGVCFDEKKEDSLENYEITDAVQEALKNTGHEGEKLEFIGYDACLMQVQDIAYGNSPYFNYMIASQESESGYGWDYETWVDDLYGSGNTETILKAIVDGFIKENGGTSSSKNNQTLSYLDLAYAEEYKTAWESMAIALSSKIKSSNSDDFNTLVETAKTYAEDDEGSNYYYGLFDAKDFVSKLSANSTFNPGSSYTSAVITAHSHLVKYESKGKGAGESYGLCMYWGQESQVKSYYSTQSTSFTNWLSLVNTYGYNSQSSSSGGSSGWDWGW